jgi:hypothetical protein
MRTPLLLTCLLFAGCDVAPEPKADPDTNATAREAARHHELKDAVEARDYRDKAKAAGDATLEADKKREEALKAAGG